ncbi:hypothetical protein M413DRAFT_449351 [Hebeloma cylindrosporum]|uniref:Uncharacterized protein n=1 Tax=Hebeloma cylindrosporum TaxID=76867 RepID=A0A0C3BXK3_HEBCY|nr:hypothetical protein M413DRAFT_449351 [Hebeloma cylindrosporum h7]
MTINAEMQDVAKKAGTEYVKGLAKEGGKETAAYEAEHGQQQVQDAQQQVDDAKAQAQGMWAKYCGCLSGA